MLTSRRPARLGHDEALGGVDCAVGAERLEALVADHDLGLAPGSAAPAGGLPAAGRGAALRLLVSLCG